MSLKCKQCVKGFSLILQLEVSGLLLAKNRHLNFLSTFKGNVDLLQT